jgi:hypothetical protein
MKDEECYKIIVENIKGRDHLGDIGVIGRTILKRIFKKLDASVWI